MGINTPCCERQVEHMSKKTEKKGNPFRTVIIVTVVLAVLTAGCVAGSMYISNNRNELLQAEIDAVNARNQQREQEYLAQLSAFEREHNQAGANDAWPVPQGIGWEIIDLSSYPLEEATTKTVARQDAMYNGMLLVNQWHAIPADFSEDGLVRVSSATNRQVPVSSNSVRMFPDAVAALRDCIVDAKAAGLDYYVAYEGYRSAADQQKLVDDKRTSIPAGCSDYNAGQSVQINLYHRDDKAINDYSSHIFESDHGLWLVNEGWKYGLVMRFPLADYPVKGTVDKSYKTGVSTKLQTLRYVGKGNAAAMHAMDFCLEEYLEYLGDHPHIAVFEDGALRYEIVRQFVGNDEYFNVTVTSKRSVTNTMTSLDNMGYAVTVFTY